MKGGGYSFDTKDIRSIAAQGNLRLQGYTRSQQKLINIQKKTKDEITNDDIKYLCEYHAKLDEDIDKYRGGVGEKESYGDHNDKEIVGFSRNITLAKIGTLLLTAAAATGLAFSTGLFGKKTKKKPKKGEKIKKKNSRKGNKSKRNEDESLFGNKGDIYESSICGYLGSAAAGPTHDVPDCWFNSDGNKQPLEVKLSLSADFGQINMRYDTDKSKFIWGNSNNTEMMDYYNKLPIIYNSVTYNSVLDLVNAVWDFAPSKSLLTSRSSKQEHMEAWIKDKAKFKNHIVYIPFDTIIKFYTNKKFEGKQCNYIQIGHKDAIKGSSTKINTPSKSLGLFYLNGTNTENIVGATQFDTKLNKNGEKCCKLRIRFKTTSSGSKTGKPTWSFLVALQCVQIKPSKCSIDDPKRNGSDGTTQWIV